MATIKKQIKKVIAKSFIITYVDDNNNMFFETAFNVSAFDLITLAEGRAFDGFHICSVEEYEYNSENFSNRFFNLVENDSYTEIR